MRVPATHDGFTIAQRRTVHRVIEVDRSLKRSSRLCDVPFIALIPSDETTSRGTP
jgi:hypothetical protein